MNVLTQDKVFSHIEGSGLRPQDIVQASMGCVSLNQAYLWFGAQKKGKNLSRPVLWMLYRMSIDHGGAQPDTQESDTDNFALAAEENIIPESTSKTVSEHFAIPARDWPLTLSDARFYRDGSTVLFGYKGCIYEFFYRAQRKILFQHQNEDLIAYAEFKKGAGPVVFEEQEI